MAGWTTSEVVLTQSLAERTKVVSKFLHIAKACQRLHNYATVTQIVMGLQSNHVSALKKTWEGLSSKDMKLWHELQELVDSRKNWSKMRNEMEKSTVGPRRKGEGCIPFVGIHHYIKYTNCRYFYVGSRSCYHPISIAWENRLRGP